MDEIAPWDIVAVMPIAQANLALAKTYSSKIITFEAKSSILNLSGTLGAWQIVTGGSMQKLRLSVPINSGTVVWNNEGGKQQSLDGIALTLEVELKFLTQEQQANLCFDFSQYDKTVWFIPPTHIDLKWNLDEIHFTEVGQGIAKALGEKSEELSQILATIDLSGSTASWLAISQKDWCYAETEKKNAYIAIFCLTDGRTDASLQPGIPPGLLDKNEIGLAIGQHVFLNDGLKGLLAHHFRPHANFTYDANTGNVSLAKHVKLPVQHRSGKDFYSTIKSMVLSPAPNAIKGSIEVDVSTTVIWQIIIYSYTEFTLPFRFDQKSGKCIFDSDPNPKMRYDTNGSALVKPFLKFFIGFFIDNNKVLSNEVTQYAAEHLQSFDSPFTLPIRWIGSKESKFKSAEFNGGLTFFISYI